MQELINFWKSYYYTEPALNIVLCISLIASLLKRKKFTQLKYIPLYISSLLIVGFCSALYNGHYISHLSFGLADYVDYFFTLIELLIFSHFYYNLTSNIAVKKLVISLNLIFSAFFLYMLITDKEFSSSISVTTKNQVYTIEGIVLLLICLSYFFELFKKPPLSKLKNDPVFWVSTGLLFFLTCTLPFSFLENYIRKYHHNLLYWTYPIFYIFYILLFLMIIRAYLCKPQKHTELSSLTKSALHENSDRMKGDYKIL